MASRLSVGMKHGFLVMGILIAIIESLGGCDSTDYASCLVVSPSSGNAGEAPYYNDTNVDGTMKNTCGHNLGYVSVDYRLYDKSGSAIGYAIDTNGAGLGDGETWKFHAIGTNTYSRFSVSEVTAH